MAGDEVRQRKGGGRKKPKKGKGKGQGGLDRTGSLDGQNDLLLPPSHHITQNACGGQRQNSPG